MSDLQVTTIPGMVAALYDRLVAHQADEGSPLEGVQLVLGQPPHAHLEDDLIIVGFSTERAITSTQERKSLGAKRDQENYEVPVLVSAQAGDDSAHTALARCGALLEALHTAIAADRTFGGLVLHTAISQLNLDPLQSATGPCCTAEVVLAVSGLTRK